MIGWGDVITPYPGWVFPRKDPSGDPDDYVIWFTYGEDLGHLCRLGAYGANGIRSYAPFTGWGDYITPYR